jgi:hypothetical protein
MRLAHRRAVQVDAVGVVNQAVDDRIAIRGIADHFMMPQSLIGESLT